MGTFSIVIREINFPDSIENVLLCYRVTVIQKYIMGKSFVKKA